MTRALFFCLLLASCGGGDNAPEPVTDQVALQIIRTAKIPAPGGNSAWQVQQQTQCSNDSEDPFPDCLWGTFQITQQVTMLACPNIGDWCFVSRWDRFAQDLPTVTACFWSKNGQVLRSDQATLDNNFNATCEGPGTPTILWSFNGSHLIEPLSGAVLILNENGTCCNRAVWPN